MNGWKKALLGAAAVAVLGTGCATSKASAPEIKDDWVARVPADQMQPINDARDTRRQSEDEFKRAEVAVKDARNQLDVTENRHAAARSLREAEEASVKAAKAKGDQTLIDSAQKRLNHAQLSEKASQANVDLRRQTLEAAEAKRDLAKAHQKLSETQLQHAEFKALQQEKDTRVQNMDPQQFDAAIQQRQAEITQNEAKVNKEEMDVRNAEQKLQQMNEQLRAAGPASTPAG